MKIYIIVEGSFENIIRCVTASRSASEKIVDSFSYLGLTIIEKELIEDEKLKDFLSCNNKEINE